MWIRKNNQDGTGGKGNHLFLLKKENRRQSLLKVLFILSLIMLLIKCLEKKEEEQVFSEQQEQVQEEKQENKEQITQVQIVSEELQILPEYKKLYDQNQDMIGWLSIKDTIINYPVMQTMENEKYYLDKDFDKEKNKNGCLIMDTDSVVGEGSRESGYKEGNKPSSNLIIHGHTMKSGSMFGNLALYEEEAYGKQHNIISFDSLYEKREYELISVFYSQVFYQHENVFKYYKFFQADTQEEFDDWYNSIKEMSLYDTGVEAKLGDEFITLSACAYHVEDGRFVVVGKRINKE